MAQVAPARGPVDAPYDPELGDHLRVLWRAKIPIALGTLAAVAVVFAISSFLPKVYRATATLMVVHSKFSSDQLLNPLQVAQTARTYEGVIKNVGALAETIEKLQLGAPPRRFDVRDLERKVDVGTVKDTSLLTVSVEMDDPTVAAEAANFLARRSMALNDRLNEGEIGESRTFLEKQVADAAAILADAEQKIERFRADSNVEILRKEFEVALARLGELETQRSRVATDLSQGNGRLASLESELRNHPKTIKTSRALVEDAAYQQALAKLSREQVDGLAAMKMESEELNPTHTAIEQKLAEARGEASGLKARQQELDRLLAENDRQLHAVQDRVNAANTELERLTRAYEGARTSYTALRQRFENARVELVSKTSVLTLVDAALPPKHHVGPRRVRNAAAAGLVAFFGMVMLAFLVDYVRRTPDTA